MLVGIVDKVKGKVIEMFVELGKLIIFDVVFNFEFLKEGVVVNDCMWFDCIVFGIDSEKVEKKLCELYVLFNCNYDKVIIMDICFVELMKYVVNCMLVIKISFMNEMVNLVEYFGVDIENVCWGIGFDLCIGY